MPFGVPELTSRGKLQPNDKRGQLCAHHSSAMLIQHGPLSMRLGNSCPAQRTHPRRILERRKVSAAPLRCVTHKMSSLRLKQQQQAV